MTRKTILSPEGLAVIFHIRAQGRVTVEDLIAQFPGESRATLHRRLSNLVSGGWLDAGCDATGTKYWTIRPSARTAVVAALTPPIAVPSLVPPRRINVMAGTYAPYAFAPARPGAMDFAAVASRGHSC